MTIHDILNLEGYANDNRLARRKTGVNTQEFFTPYEIVKKMCDKISDEDWKDPNKTFLEPSFGNGQFILYIIYKRLHSRVDWKTTLETLYGVELMEDNVQECKERILDLLDKLQIKYDKELALQIMGRNLICHDFFTWNFEEWRPYSSDELKLIQKRSHKK